MPAKPENRLVSLVLQFKNWQKVGDIQLSENTEGMGSGENYGKILCPHIGPADRGVRLREGMVINIEPMINIGMPETR